MFNTSCGPTTNQKVTAISRFSILPNKNFFLLPLTFSAFIVQSFSSLDTQVHLDFGNNDTYSVLISQERVLTMQTLRLNVSLTVSSKTSRVSQLQRTHNRDVFFCLLFEVVKPFSTLLQKLLLSPEMPNHLSHFTQYK